jgi:predicted Zn-dependent protease
VNAFACPGGFVYIHKGLLDKLNQDELAFVLAHEVGHVTARHAVKRIQADLGFQMVISLALLGTGQEQAAALGNISGTVYNLVALGYSREDEMLADKLGIKYASRAAYDPNGGIGALEKLKQEGGSWHVPFLSTHPDIDARIKKAKAEVAALPKK